MARRPGSAVANGGVRGAHAIHHHFPPLSAAALQEDHARGMASSVTAAVLAQLPEVSARIGAVTSAGAEGARTAAQENAARWRAGASARTFG